MIFRFIYVYREKATGRAVYVGSAFDVAARDREHCRLNAIPFDREITRRGRDSFTMEIVESLKAESTIEVLAAAVIRENHWMDVLSTFRTEHGFNFQPCALNYDTEQHRQAAAAANRSAATNQYKNPRARKAASEAAKKRWANPKNRCRHSEIQKIAHRTPEALANHSRAAGLHAAASNKKRWTPDERTKQSTLSSAQMVREHRIRKLTKRQPLLPYPLLWRERYLGIAA